MEDFVEDYKYNNCFWKKSGVLYNHAESKFSEYMSIGEMLSRIVQSINSLCAILDKVPNLYKPSDDTISTRGNGITVFIHFIENLNKEFRKLSKNINYISSKVVEKKFSYDSKRQATKMCDDYFKKYQNELTKLKQVKKIYFDTINKGIEYYLTQKFANKLNSNKVSAELENRKSLIKSKKLDYKKQIENVESCRVEYMEVQGNIFASEEELERECTDELKNYFKEYFGFFQDFQKVFILPEEDLKTIEKIDGSIDNKSFAERNKSLMTGPKRNLFKEYSQDLIYYSEHFDVIKSKIKGKNPQQLREFNNKLTTDVTLFLKDIIKEEPDQIYLQIEQIAKNIKENQCTQKEYDYLEDRFIKSYEEFQKWKQENVRDQDYRKIGKEWDERFGYMHIFLGYFNKSRVGNKKLDKTNFDFLCNAIMKILELNENEDIDYNLCNLLIILSSTYYTSEPNHKNGKMYINEVIRNSSIMKRQGFWVGLTRYELNEEIQQQNTIEDTLKEDNISEDKLKNSVTTKLMSISFNLIQFITDSNLFNRVLFDIFKYCKLNAENRALIVEMIENQIKNENLTHLQLDRKLLLTPITNPIEETIDKTPETSSKSNGND